MSCFVGPQRHSSTCDSHLKDAVRHQHSDAARNRFSSSTLGSELTSCSRLKINFSREKVANGQTLCLTSPSAKTTLLLLFHASLKRFRLFNSNVALGGVRFHIIIRSFSIHSTTHSWFPSLWMTRAIKSDFCPPFYRPDNTATWTMKS